VHVCTCAQSYTETYNRYIQGITNTIESRGLDLQERFLESVGVKVKYSVKSKQASKVKRLDVSTSGLKR
jgi:hypothetical protein